VPIFQRGGSPAAALSLTGEPKELLGKKQAPMVAALQAAAAEISRYMGFFEAVP
jgi:DNA-binding IclR family transcriptional regulator